MCMAMNAVPIPPVLLDISRLLVCPGRIYLYTVPTRMILLSSMTKHRAWLSLSVLVSHLLYPVHLHRVLLLPR